MKLTDPIAGLVTYTFIILGLIGVIIPFAVNAVPENGLVDLNGSIGLGVIMASIFGGIGSALFVRRRAMFNDMKNPNTWKEKIDYDKTFYSSTLNERKRMTRVDLENEIDRLESKLQDLTSQLERKI